MNGMEASDACMLTSQRHCRYDVAFDLIQQVTWALAMYHSNQTNRNRFIYYRHRSAVKSGVGLLSEPFDRPQMTTNYQFPLSSLHVLLCSCMPFGSDKGRCMCGITTQLRIASKVFMMDAWSKGTA